MKRKKKGSANSLTDKVNPNNMDVCNELDVYIPKEADVRNVPLNSLPNSVLRRMGLPLPDRKCADCPDIIWICPFITKRKGCGPVSHRESYSLEKLQIVSNPLQMSFISSNHLAWKMLKNISSGAGNQMLPQDSAPLANQDAVVIYQERIYLCIRRSTKNQGPPKTRELQPSPRPAGPSTSTSPEQAPGSDSRQTHAAGKGLKRKAVSPVPAAHLPPQSTGGERKGGPSLMVPRPEPAPEEASKRQKITTDGGEQDDHGDAAGSSWNLACDLRRNSPDRSWVARETLGAASASSSLSREFDFKELENEEKIAQLKAKFLQADAALDHLLF